MVFPEEAIGARAFPKDLALHLNGYYAARGVDVRAGAQVEAVVEERGGFTVRTSRGEIAADVPLDTPCASHRDHLS